MQQEAGLENMSLADAMEELLFRGGQLGRDAQLYPSILYRWRNSRTVRAHPNDANNIVAMVCTLPPLVFLHSHDEAYCLRSPLRPFSLTCADALPRLEVTRAKACIDC
jgi:hypothetical protein